MKFTLLDWMPFIYGVSFVALGCSAPYLALELQERGVVQLSLLLAFPAISNVLLGPVLGVLADATKAWGLILRVCACLTFVGMLSVAFFPPELIFWAVLLWSIARTPLWPLSDALALEATGSDVVKYGRLRLWGSLGYLVGALMASGYRQFYGGKALLLASAVWGCFFIMTLRVPNPKQMPSQRLLSSVRVLISDPVLALILLTAALHFGAHFAASTFLANHIQSLGLDDGWTGISIALGVLVEVGVMAFGPIYLSRYHASVYFGVATVIACFRWYLMTIVADPFLIALTRSLHGFSFGLFWLAVVKLVSERSPVDAKASGQALLGAAVGGVGAGGGVYCGAWVVENSDTWGLYHWAQQLSLVTVVLAGGIIWISKTREKVGSH